MQKYTCSNTDFETETAIKEELGHLAVAGTGSLEPLLHLK